MIKSQNWQKVEIMTGLRNQNDLKSKFWQKVDDIKKSKLWHILNF